jgi:hypothetical protein
MQMAIVANTLRIEGNARAGAVANATCASLIRDISFYTVNYNKIVHA